MGQINDTTLKALTLSLRSEFNEGLKKKAPTWGKIAMRIPSSTATNMDEGDAHDARMDWQTCYP